MMKPRKILNVKCDSEKQLAPPVMLESTNMYLSTAQGGGGSFKNRKPIGEVGFCESGMAKRIH